MMHTTAQVDPAAELFRKESASNPIIEAEELPLCATYYPFGFPAEVRTNSARVLEQFEQLWGMFYKLRDTERIQCDVRFVEDSSTVCPPEPTYHLMLPLVISIADENNFGIVDLERMQVKISVSSAALLHPSYVQYCLLGMPGCCIATRLAPAVHAACVAFNGQGVLLCGDSGAGKSTLAYACARAGWTYITDDGAYVFDAVNREVTGNCYQMRFRPPTAEMFPELAGHAMTCRPGGKLSIELPTAHMTDITRSQTAHIDYVVFLNRRAPGPPQLIPFSQAKARRSMREVVYGPPESLEFQHQAIETLLAAPLFELQYTDLDWAVERLQALVTNGK
jgi:hypothetical protein